MPQEWLAIIEGNTHHRWGWFRANQLQKVEAFSPLEAPDWPENQEIWLASVGRPVYQRITSQQIVRLQLSDVPLAGLYANLGLDRALALLAAGWRYSWPSLVIDGGTALTLTAADGKGRFVGGAILPGLALQARALHEYTVALPNVDFTADIPEGEWRVACKTRWGMNTQDAIHSGILRTVVAGLADFVQDWWGSYPNGCLVVTGGDSPLLSRWLGWHLSNTLPQCQVQRDPDLVLQGIAICRANKVPP
ncbi:MAG: type III pantothenate kinase [Cyanobacteriota bacterium]|nr:type III pantothenate kinase [Cyanobacteriota bacterium]